VLNNLVGYRNLIDIIVDCISRGTEAVSLAVLRVQKIKSHKTSVLSRKAHAVITM